MADYAAILPADYLQLLKECWAHEPENRPDFKQIVHRLHEAAIRAEFQWLDADQDGRVTREEWRTRFGNLDSFDEYDEDGSGCVSPEEFLQHRKLLDAKVCVPPCVPTPPVQRTLRRTVCFAHVADG